MFLSKSYYFLPLFLLTLTNMAMAEFNDLTINKTNQKIILDSNGLKVIHGPVGVGIYDHVHIISDTVGVSAQSVFITNSIIEAPVCISVDGYNNHIESNQMNCGLCVRFNTSSLIDNYIANNKCTGQGTNRPDVFGW